MKGFLGTWAGFASDLNLLIQIAMGALLTAAAFLARANRYRAHGICTSIVVLLNLPMITIVMWPSFHQLVMPLLSKHISKPYYAIAAAHGVLGAAAELLGLYILLVAGTNIVPRPLRFRRWKLWMQVELGLWWAALLAGVGTYWIWYVK